MELPDFPGAPRIEGYSFLEPCLLLRQAGQGGMGLVYEAYDVLRSRKVAVKVSSNPAYSPRFYLEAVLGIADLGEHVVQVIDIRRFRETDYILMEWVDGGDLQTMTEAGALSAGQVVEVANQICSGLSRIHAQGVIHRDIKPANLMVTYEGVVKLADLGIAQSSEALHMATVGPIGTRIFMAPEQREGHTADECSDMYSLGITLYMLATGLMNRQRSEELTRMLRDGLSPVLEVQPDLNPTLAALINRCSAWEREDRFQNTSELAEALGALEIQGQPVIPNRTRLVTGVPSEDLIRRARALRGEASFGKDASVERTEGMPVSSVVAPTPEPPQQSTPNPWLQRTGGVIGLVVLSVIGALAFDGVEESAGSSIQASKPPVLDASLAQPSQTAPPTEVATTERLNQTTESLSAEESEPKTKTHSQPVGQAQSIAASAKMASPERNEATPTEMEPPAFQLQAVDGFEVQVDEHGFQAYVPLLKIELNPRLQRKLRFADLKLKDHPGLLVQEMEVASELAFVLGVLKTDPKTERCLPWQSVSLDLAEAFVERLNATIPDGASYHFLVPSQEQRMLVENSPIFCSLILDSKGQELEDTATGNAPSTVSSIQWVDPLRVYTEGLWNGSKTTGLFGFVGNVSEVCSMPSSLNPDVIHGDYRGGSIMDLQFGPIAADNSEPFTRDYSLDSGGVRLFLLLEAK